MAAATSTVVGTEVIIAEVPAGACDGTTVGDPDLVVVVHPENRTAITRIATRKMLYRLNSIGSPKDQGLKNISV